MLKRKQLKRYLLAAITPLVLLFAYAYFYDSYLFSFSKAAFLKYEGHRYDRGTNAHFIFSLALSTVVYISVLIGSYELTLLALGGRFKGED